MKKFDTPMVTISQEEYEQLQECKTLVNMLWMRFGPYQWPKVFQLPKGTTWKDLDKPERKDDFDFYRFVHRVDVLMNFDDSE